MTKPTREQIEAAYFATEQLVLRATVVRESPAVKDYREMILKALPPMPRPTMEGVVWDDKKHFLAVVDVDHEEYKKAIMLKQNVYDDTIQCFALHPYKCVVCHFGPALLTPTGERYTFTGAQDD